MFAKTKKFPVFKQTDRFDCGPACLKMICKYYGRDFNIEELRLLCKITPDGVIAKNLLHAMESLGLSALPASIDFETLKKEAPLPCIVYWRDRHYVIVYRIKKNTVYVADPLHGRIKYSKEEFIKAWQNSTSPKPGDQGVVLLLEPTVDFYQKENSEKAKGLRTLIPYFKNYSSYIWQVLLGLLVGIVIQLCLPFLTKSLVDKGINFKDVNFVYVLLAAQLMLFLSSSVITILRSWLLLFVGARASMLITSDYLNKLLRKSLSFFDSKTPGDILQRIRESSRIETFLTAAPERIFSYFNALIFLVFIGFYSLTILGIFIVGIVLYSLWVSHFIKKRRELDFKRFDAASRINSTLIQTVNGIQEVKVNGSAKKHVADWERERIGFYKNAISNLRLQHYQSIGGNIINEAKNIIITFTAALLVINDSISLGAMLAIQYIIGQINAPLLDLIEFFRLIQDAQISLERFEEIDVMSEEEKQLNDTERTIPLRKGSDSIELKNLYFSYSGRMDDCVLKNINLTIPKGRVTAIVGSSGSGKTTLVKLLLKLYLPTSGRINVGNTDLNAVRTNDWRAACGTVLQDGYIFSDSIANNITESCPDEPVDVDRLLESVKIANIESLINDLPSGFNSMIGPAGSSGRTLSGGQQQRILISRAVYKDPDYLFFDEATSALDAKNEKQIVDNLNEFSKNKTVVVVAHRLSTVMNADQIIVLEDGEIKELGNHMELVDLEGSYFNLVKNQLALGN